VRKALATLPWVEQSSIQTDVDKREVRFNLNLKDKTAWPEEEVRQALKDQKFPEMTVKSVRK
jgi:hypothetical protein